MKARYLDERHAGHGVTFATGTPISNTMVEMYTVQRFLDPEGLQSRGIEHFDAWAATFGEVVDTMEISPDGASLRPRSRFARFTNLPELQQMFRAFADVQTAEMLDLPRPRLETGKAIVIACPMSDEQATLQGELVARYDRLRTQKVDPRDDNALAITTDGRKLALDARMLTGAAPDHPGSKLNALVEQVATIWQRTAATRGTQMTFCDMGVNPTPWGYSAYEEIVDKLVAARHPPRANCRHRRRRLRRQEAVALREGQERCRPRAPREHPEDGHRHERPETPRGPPSPRCPVEAGRGRAARGPHPPPGERQRGSRHLPLRHRGIIRRLYVAGTRDQGAVYRPGHNRRERRPPRRGHRQPGALLRGGEGHRLGQPRRADARRGGRRAKAPGHPEEEPRRRAVSRPPQHPRAARRHQSAHHARRRSHRGPRDAGRPCRRSHHHRRPGVCGAGRVEAAWPST